MTNKRYKDLIDQYTYRGENTPFTIGTLVVCCLCFLLLLVTTFTQLHIVHPWVKYDSIQGFMCFSKELLYSPQIPAAIFIIYLLGRFYSILVTITYLLVGFFALPIFVSGGGLDYVKTHPFGFFVGFILAIFLAGYILKFKQTIRTRIVAGIFGVFAIHIGIIVYSLFLAIFRMLEFSMISPILVNVVGSKIIYDIIFTILIMLVAPYIKSFLWICMKPKADKKKNKPSKRNL